MAISVECEEEVNDYYDNIADNSDNDLLNQLVSDCNAPIKYLEKRGYLQKGKLKPVKLNEETKLSNDDTKYKKNFFYFPKSSNFNELKSKKLSRSGDLTKQELKKSANDAYDEGIETQSNADHLVEKLNGGATAAVLDGNDKILKSTVQEKETSSGQSEQETNNSKSEVKEDDPGFFRKLKHRIRNLFGGKLDDDSYYMDDSSIDDGSYLDETFNGLYPDDSELDDEYGGMYNDFLMPEKFPNMRSIRSEPLGSNAGFDPTTEHVVITEKEAKDSKTNKTSTETEKTTAKNDKNVTSPENKEASTSDNSTISKPATDKDEELFKNLTEIDRAYVKSIINCYLENKKKFSIDLRPNETLKNNKTTSDKTTGIVNITTVDENSTNSSKPADSQNTTSNENGVKNNTNSSTTTTTEAPKSCNNTISKVKANSTSKVEANTTSKAESSTSSSTEATSSTVTSESSASM